MISALTRSFRGGWLFQYLSAVALGAAGYVANLFPIELAFGLSFILGGFLPYFFIRFLGFFPVVLCAAICGAATYQLWGHPYAAIVFTLSVAFNSAVLSRRKWPILVSDIFFWIMIGAPLLWLGYRHGLGMGAEAVKIVALKQALNNFLLSMSATAVYLAAIGINANLTRRNAGRVSFPSISLRGYLGILLVIFAAIPTVGALVLGINQQHDHYIADARQKSAAGAKAVADAFLYQRQSLLQSAYRAVVAGRIPVALTERDGSISLLNVQNQNFVDYGDVSWKRMEGPGISGFKSIVKIGRLDSSFSPNLVNYPSVDVWVSQQYIFDMGSNILRGSSAQLVSWARLQDTPELDGAANLRTYMVLGGKSGQSLMQRWAQGSFLTPAVFPDELKGIELAVQVPLQSYYDRLNKKIFLYLTLAVILVFTMPFLAWVATADLVNRISALPKRLAAIVELDINVGRERRSVFRELNAISDQTRGFAIKLAAEVAETNRYRQLLDQIMAVSSTIFFILDYDKKAGVGKSPKYISPSISVILGVEPEVGMAPGWFRSNVHPDDYVRVAAESAIRDESIRDKGAWRTELRFRHPAGGWHHFSVEMFRSEASENHYNDAAVFGVMIDITERKQAEERLLHHSRLADLGVMATGIAHELNQPLDIIKLMATNMEDLVAENEADSDYLLTKLRSIVAQVERAARITNHMRLFGRSENVPAAPVLLNDLLFEMVELLHSQTSLRNIELKLDLPEEPLSVLGRANLIEQVFLNLVINAMRQIDDGEPPGDSGAGLRQISLRMQSEQEGRWVSVKCADRAGGIDPVVLGRIFDPFVTTRGPGMGTGLGLSVAFDIIDEMGGEISAENRDGGAVFTVLLPLVDRVSTEPALVGA